MIYFNKLIDICINRYESQKVVDNYFVGTNKVQGNLYFIFELKTNKSSRERDELYNRILKNNFNEIQNLRKNILNSIIKIY